MIDYSIKALFLYKFAHLLAIPIIVMIKTDLYFDFEERKSLLLKQEEIYSL